MWDYFLYRTLEIEYNESQTMKLTILYLKIILLALFPSITLGYDIQLLTPQSDAEEYEFVIYPDGVEKRFTNTAPVIDSNELPLGQYEYKRRIKNNNQWSDWSKVKIMNVSAYSEKYKRLRIDEIKTPTTFVVEKRPKTQEKTVLIEPPVEPPPAPILLNSPSKDSAVTPFFAALSRSVKTENESASAESQESAQRLGLNFQNKSYDSQFFYETGSTYSRMDLWAMKALTSYLQIGARLTHVSANFKTAEARAETTNTFALFQVSTKHETESGYGFLLSGAGTLQGSFMGGLHASKSWQIGQTFRLTPTIGYEYLNLKTNTTIINSMSWLAGLFVELNF